MNPCSLCGYLGLIALGTAVFAADLLDAPGPGYRKQAESLRASPSPDRLREILLQDPTYRPYLLDALPSSGLSPADRVRSQERLHQRWEQFRGIRIYTHPLSLSLEIQRLSPTILELPTENPFVLPFRLFTYPGDPTPLQGYIFHDR